MGRAPAAGDPRGMARARPTRRPWGPLALAVAGVAVGAALAALCWRTARHEWGGPTVALPVGEPHPVTLDGHERWAVYVRGGERASDPGVRCRLVDGTGAEIHEAAADESWWSTLGVDLPHRGLGNRWRRLAVYAVPGTRRGAATITVTCPQAAPAPAAGMGPAARPPHPPEAYGLGPAPNGPGALARVVLGALLFLVGAAAGGVAAGCRARRVHGTPGRPPGGPAVTPRPGWAPTAPRTKPTGTHLCGGRRRRRRPSGR